MSLILEWDSPEGEPILTSARGQTEEAGKITPQEFVSKSLPSSLKETSASQEHFINLCRLIGHSTPAEADPEGTWFCFEKGATEAGLKKRTLTNLHNERSTGFDLSHRRLDDAVLDAHGWPRDLTGEQIPRTPPRPQSRTSCVNYREGRTDMSVFRGRDVCGECNGEVANDGPDADPTERKPFPHCGSTERIVFAKVHAAATASASVDAKLIIGWQEVTRLLDRAEYAAALLVAAVNVEFILWEKLRRFPPARPVPRSIRDLWGQVRANKREGVTLGSLLQVAACFAKQYGFALSPSWDPLACQINEVRNRIAHERGYFAKLTQLKDTDWPETRIRQVLEDAREFCDGNAP